MNVRSGAGDDVPVLAQFFYAMLVESDLLGSGLVANWDAVLKEHFRSGMDSGDIRTFVAEVDGAIVATACVSPRSSNGSNVFLDHWAMLWGVYVAPPFRRSGIARALTESAIAWCHEQGFVQIRLQTSRAGRKLYASLGFTDGDEMRLDLS